MGVFDIPQPEPKPEKPAVEVTTPSYKHSIVESTKTPIETMATYIGGSNWTVDYYSQVLESEEELKAFDPEQHIAYQSYNKINRLVIKLQGALSTTDDTGTARMETVGSAIIPPMPGLIPNLHDVIIGDVGEGTAGQFTITSIRKLTLNAATAYEIEFSLARVATEKITRLLDDKVVNVYHFRRDSLILGQNPLLLDAEFDATRTLEHYLKEITTLWVSGNFSYTHNTFVIPGQTQPIYDPYVTRAALKIISPDEHRLIRSVVEYNCDDHRIPKYDDIYTAMMKRDAYLIPRVFKGFNIIDYRALLINPYQNSIRYSGIHYGIVPSTMNVDADDYSGLSTVPGLNSISLNTTVTGDTAPSTINDTPVSCPADPNIPCDATDWTPNPNPGTNTTTPPNYGELGNIGMDIPPITSASYTLSTSFYAHQLTKMTQFERLVWQTLEDKRVAYQDVYPFCKAYAQWGRLEQFYLGPILIMLIRSALRSI